MAQPSLELPGGASVSTVVCTFNGAAWVGEQLQTLLTQSRLPTEIVIGDDGSTDGTWDLIEAFAVQSRVRGIEMKVFRNSDSLGYVENLARTLAHATGDVVFLCDQYDAWHPDKIATMMVRFEADSSLTFIHSDARLVDAEGRDTGHGLFEAVALGPYERESVRSGDAFITYLRRNLATGAASAFRRSLLDIALPLPPDWVHDAWLATLAAAVGKVDIIDDALVDYRQHGGNQIGMARRTPKQRVTDMFRPRNETIRSDAARLDALAERLEGRCADDACIEATRSMREHLRARLAIGAQPAWRRVRGVLREWSSGRYGLFGTGARSAVRDLLRIG
ncbi:glycosyltransferase family 2 protein [Luteibacter sp. 3190]|uniref:glycosyltransferase family 2 protein n=1 Tax=Luteibacter sp. 3190 TaxID=2817736 RepID=UPI00285ED857|nr:glycosyltransferase family 2 protein [Luteibacter sp. 3190]MDR6936845.1 glycosyltransferase involved in cell wall biosynthesis [Luteibacter sp. 3190]